MRGGACLMVSSGLKIGNGVYEVIHRFMRRRGIHQREPSIKKDNKNIDLLKDRSFFIKEHYSRRINQYFCYKFDTLLFKSSF